MSFVCQSCRKAQPKRTAPIKLVVEKREKFYEQRPATKKDIKKGNRKGDKGGKGWEIVREIDVCSDCFAVTEQRG